MDTQEIEFKEQMRKKIIPKVEEMLEKEIAHKKYLMSYYKKTKSRFLFNDTKSIKKFLINSYCSITHLSHRLNQYKKYIQ